jgi:hypothetical protein
MFLELMEIVRKAGRDLIFGLALVIIYWFVICMYASEGRKPHSSSLEVEREQRVYNGGHK